MFFRSGIRLGKLFGIQIVLDWSLIAIFTLVAFSLGEGAFPTWHPDWSVALRWTVALAAAVLFFVSILLHELSHALVAKHYGIPVNRITLFLFGGVANIEHDPDSPKKEALMAAVGPLTSIVLGVGFSLLGGLSMAREIGAASDPTTVVRQMGPLTTLLAWLGPVNVMLGVFNMLPGFPLDGGRVLRATLWAATRDLRKATRWAARVGQLFGWALMSIGFAMMLGLRFPVLGTGLVNGLWLAFIGWFLSNAAAASYRQLLIKESLAGVQVAHLMRRGLPPTLPASALLSALVDRFMRQPDEPLLAIGSDDRIEGFVRPADLRHVPRAEWESRTAGELAASVTERPTLRPDESAYDALGRMTRDDADALVVVHAGEVLGVLRRDDVARWLSLQADDSSKTASGRFAGSRL